MTPAKLLAACKALPKPRPGESEIVYFARCEAARRAVNKRRHERSGR